MSERTFIEQEKHNLRMMTAKGQDPMRTTLQAIAERATARVFNVSVEEVQAIADNPEDDVELVGMASAVWMTFLTQMLQLLMEMLGDCPARKSTFTAIRKPGIFARAVARTRANRIFSSGDSRFTRMGTAAVEALEEESAALKDEEITVAINEVQNPNRYMVI